MKLPNLFEVSDQDEDKPFRIMNQRRSRFDYNNLNDEKSQLYQLILSKTEEETSRIQELYEHVDSLLSEDLYVNFTSLRIENTMLMLKKGIDFASKAYDTQENFTSEIKEYIDNLICFKKDCKGGGKNLMEEIRFKRQQLLSSKKKTAMYKRNKAMFTSMKKS